MHQNVLTISCSLRVDVQHVDAAFDAGFEPGQRVLRMITENRSSVGKHNRRLTFCEAFLYNRLC
jgi:hypothetical protein